MKDKLIFSIAEIQEKEGLTFTETAPVGNFLSESPDLSGSCTVHLEFSVGGESILMEGKVQGQWNLSCSRCLEEHAQDFEYGLEETYPLSQGTIDLREDVRQALLLSVPVRSLCKSDCLGLCPQCGKNLNEGFCACKTPVQH